MKKFFGVVAIFLLAAALGGCTGGTVKTGPTVTLSASTTTGGAPLAVTLTFSAADADGTIIRIVGDLDGNGSFETDLTGLATIDTTFTSNGTFTVSVKATDNDNLTATATVEIIVADPGDVVKTLAYPTGLVTAKDLVFTPSGDSFWVLGNDGSADVLMRVDPEDATVLGLIRLTGDARFLLAPLGQLAYDGTFFWITTGIGLRDTLKVNSSGAVVAALPCRATATGICRGITWDGTNLWAGGSDTRDVVEFTTANTVVSTLTSPDPTAGTEDVGYDSSRDRLIVVSTSLRNLYMLNPSTGATIDAIFVNGRTTGGFETGENLWWTVDNTAKLFKAVFTD